MELNPIFDPAKPSPPEGVFDDVGKTWLLKQDWQCEMSDGRVLCVKAGMTSDGASIPSWLWSFPFIGPYIGAPYKPSTFASAFFHDCCYASEITPRQFADFEFNRLLIMHGAGATRARLYWLAVRGCGWAVWRKHSPDSIAQARRFVSIGLRT